MNYTMRGQNGEMLDEHPPLDNAKLPSVLLAHRAQAWSDRLHV